MIYTVTFNPSLDYFVTVKDFKLHKTNRTSSERILPGGKGFNVSMVLKNLGIANTALGFVAGYTGEAIVRLLDEKGIRTELIEVPEGLSRINVKMKNYEGTEINGMGPSIDDAQLEILMCKLRKLKSGDILVLAGSIPPSMPDTLYEDIMRELEGQGILFVVDATQKLLLNVLKYKPFLIKPNHQELGEIFGVKLSKRTDVIPYAKKLQENGARNVLVSMGGKGAVLVDENGKVHMMRAPKGEVVNAVGAGDSMVAGFLAGWHDKKEYGHAFRLAVASGSASAFSEDFATREEIMELYVEEEEVPVCRTRRGK